MIGQRQASILDDCGHDEQAGLGRGRVAHDLLRRHRGARDIGCPHVFFGHGVRSWLDPGNVDVADIREMAQKGVQLALQGKDLGFVKFQARQPRDMSNLFERDRHEAIVA